MGEYAKRKIDGQEIKIGTCESMYNCRYDQKDEVIYHYMSDNLYWRIPTPDEDETLPGDYDYSLLTTEGYIPWKLNLDVTKLSKKHKDGIKKTFGIIQMKEPSMGLLINIRCPHGLEIKQGKIENNSIVDSIFYNGHRDTLYLQGMKNEPKDLKILVGCVACLHMWSFSFNEIEPMIKSIWMRLRLLQQTTEYYYKHNEEVCKNTVSIEVNQGSIATISSISKGRYLVKKDEVVIADAPWHIALEEFVRLLPKPEDFNSSNIEHRMSRLYNLAYQAEEIRDNINKI